MHESESLIDKKHSKNSDFYNRVLSTVSSNSFLQKMCALGVVLNSLDIFAVCWVLSDDDIDDCKYSLRQWFTIYSLTSAISLIIQLLGLVYLFNFDESPKCYTVIKWAYILNLLFSFYWVIDATLSLASNSECAKTFKNGYILLYVLSIRYYGTMVVLTLLFGFYSFFGTAFKCMERNDD